MQLLFTEIPGFWQKSLAAKVGSLEVSNPESWKKFAEVGPRIRPGPFDDPSTGPGSEAQNQLPVGWYRSATLRQVLGLRPKNSSQLCFKGSQARPILRIATKVGCLEFPNLEPGRRNRCCSLDLYVNLLFFLRCVCANPDSRRAL